MKVRDWLNNNSAIVTIAAVVVLILSLGYIIMNAGGRRPTARVVDVYFYDLNTKALFTAKSDQIPPIETASGPFMGGPAGVRAHVFACGDCGNEADRFIGWIETYTPEAKRALEAPQTGDEDSYANYEIWERGHMVADPERLQWVGANTERGFQLMETINARCPEGNIRPCLPGRN